MIEVYYYNADYLWEKIEHLIFPNQQTYGIDSGTDTMQISFYANPNFLLPKHNAIRIRYNNVYKYFVVKDFTYNDMVYSDLQNVLTTSYQRLCTMQLVEPIEILKGFKVQACTFAQKRYTIVQVIDRLCRLALFDYKNIIMDIKYQYVDNRIDFASTSLYLALFDFARKYDRIPYLEFDNGGWTIKFQRLDGYNDKVFNGAKILTPIKQGQYIGEGLAKYVYMEANNVQTGGMAMKTFTPIATDGSSTININNFGLRSQDTIDKIIRLVIIAEDETEWVFSNSVNGTTITYQTAIEMNGYEQTRTFYIITKSAYDSLTSSQKEDYNNIYIYWENNIIYMHELEKMRPHIFGDFTNYWEAGDFLIFKEVGGIGYIHSPATDRPLWNNTFSVLGQTLITNQVPFYSVNESDYENTVFYNQTSSRLDPITMSDTLQSYIDNMASGKYFRRGIFTDYSAIPEEGSIINIDYTPYIVNSLTIVDNKDYFDVTFNLVKKHALRREYMGADTTLQLNDMTNKDLINSNNIAVTQINYSMITPIEVYNDLGNNIDQRSLVAPVRGSAITQWKWYLNFYYPTISGTDHSNTFTSYGTIDNFGNSLVFYIKALNNMVWNQDVDQDGNLIPKNYTTPGGEVFNVDMKLTNDNDSDMFVTKLESQHNIPIKDKHEVFTQTLQFIYKGTNDTIVRNEYVNHLLNTNSWEECTVLLYDTNIGQFDDKPDTYLDLTGGILSINTTEQYILISLNKVLDVSCKSIIIRGDTDILFIKNFNEETNINTGEIKIYYNIEMPIYNRTGVIGYDD